MTATDDYAAMRRMLAEPLPAYVSYDRNITVFGFTHHNIVLVRTKDKKILTKDDVKVHEGDGPATSADTPDEPLTSPIFNPSDYTPEAASTVSWEGRDVERIRLHSTKPDSKDNGKIDTTFTDVYVDPSTKAPLYAFGAQKDDKVSATVSERFTTFQNHVVPQNFKVDVSGSGMLFWLQIHVADELSHFTFYDTQPPLANFTQKSS